MSQNSDNLHTQFAEEHKLIPLQDVATIKIKLGKSHRKESDWTVIKEILSSHCVITMQPFRPDRRLSVKDHILCENDYPMVFTNIEDCQRYIRDLNLFHGTPGRGFMIGSIPFEEAVDISEKNQMELYIDRQMNPNEKCMAYVPGDGVIKAVMIVSR